MTKKTRSVIDLADDDVAAHRKRLHDADDHDAAEAWDDTLLALCRALALAPECEDRP